MTYLSASSTCVVGSEGEISNLMVVGGSQKDDDALLCGTLGGRYRCVFYQLRFEQYSSSVPGGSD